jgi:hypothetical protein
VIRRLFSVYTIRVKREPKPDPVKPQPPTARRFDFMELAVPWCIYSSHPTSSPTLLMQLQSQGYRRDPPRCFVFSSSAAPTAPPPFHWHRIISLHLLGRPPSPLKMTPTINRGCWSKASGCCVCTKVLGEIELLLCHAMPSLPRISTPSQLGQ